MVKQSKSENCKSVSVEMTMGERLLSISIDPETMTTTCVGSELGLQFLHHRHQHSKSICAILKKFLSDYYNSEITIQEKLFDNIPPASDVKISETSKKNLKASVGTTKDKKRSNILGISRDKGEKLFNTDTNSIKKTKSIINKDVRQVENVSRSGRKRKIPKWLQDNESLAIPSLSDSQPENSETEDENGSEYEAEKSSEEEDDASLSTNEEEPVKQTKVDLDLKKNSADVDLKKSSEDVDLKKNNEETELGKFSCSQCDRVMGSYFDKIQHESLNHDFIGIEDIRTSDGKIDMFKCPICKDSLKSEDGIRLHLKNHIKRDPKDLTCDICNVVFIKKERLRMHKLTHGEAKFPCSICGKKFRLPKYVRRHKRDFHKVNDDGVENKADKNCNQSGNTGIIRIKIEGSENIAEIDANGLVTATSNNQMDENDEKNKVGQPKINSGEFGDAVEGLNESRQDGDSTGNYGNDSSNIDSKLNEEMTCHHCNQSYTRKSSLKRHMLRKHGIGCDNVTVKDQTDEKIEYKCVQCNFVSYTQRDKIIHELKDHDFISLDELEAEDGKNEKIYKCPICKASRRQESSIKMHIQEHFVMDATSELTCQICNFQCKTKHRLRNHMLIHGEAKFPCSICGKKFRMIKYVRRHMVETHKQKLVIDNKGEEKEIVTIPIPKKPRIRQISICDVCGKTYNSRASMLSHRTIHSEEKPYTCKKCGKGFRLSSTLKNHLLLHQDAKNFVCEVCGKSFKIQQGLTMHTQRHHLHRKWECEICHRKFKSFGGKKYHILREHKESVDSYGLKLHPCKYCSRICSGRQELLRHESSHVDNRTQVCEICNGRFPTVSQLNVHKKIHFGLYKKFHCTTCDFKTVSGWKLKRHYRSAKHLDNCLSAHPKRLVENMKEDDSDETSETLLESSATSQDRNDRVAISSSLLEPSSENSVEEVKIKYYEIPDNLGDGCQIIYSDDGKVVYSVVEDSALEEGTYIYDPSVNQAVESILKLQSS